MGAAWLLPRLVGTGRATELLMTGDFIDAKRAHEIGLYHRVVPSDALPAEARALAERLARGPSAALAVTKDALTREEAMSLEAALELEAQLQAELMEHPNFRESYDAFVAKREPKFT
jgi:enoyl-CoA hydratase/carnithine racemase